MQHHDGIDDTICYPKFTLQITIYGCFGEIRDFNIVVFLIFNQCSNSKENYAEYIHLLINLFMHRLIHGINDHILFLESELRDPEGNFNQ